MTQPTPEQLAFHEELKGILDKHQAIIGEVALAAILTQVAGSTLAISMIYDNTTMAEAQKVIVENAKTGILSGIELIESLQKGDN